MEQWRFHKRRRPEAQEHLDKALRCRHTFDYELEWIIGSKRGEQGEEGDCEGQILGFGQSRFLECDQVASQYTSAPRQGCEMDVK